MTYESATNYTTTDLSAMTVDVIGTSVVQLVALAGLVVLIVVIGLLWKKGKETANLLH